MKIQHSKLPVVVLFFSISAISLCADPDVAPSPQAQAMEHLVVSLATGQGQANMALAIPTLVSGLSDSDVNVRRQAASGLLMIATLTSRATNSAPSRQPDLTSDPANQQALLKATSDPDDEVRLTALKAYSATYQLTPDVEDKIISEFNTPDSKENNPGDKVAMIECLLLGGSSSAKAQAFLAKTLDNPKYAPHVAERIAADNRPLSPAILDKLSANLQQDKNPQHRATFARAIGAYGKQAQQCVPQLKAALASEQDEATKANIKAAINKANQ